MSAFVKTQAILAHCALALSLLLAGGATAQHVNRCVIEGRTVFQEAVCPNALPMAGDEIRRKTQELKKSKDDQEAAAARALVEESRIRARESQPPPRLSVDAGGLCKGAIGLVMGRDPRTMAVVQEGSVWIVSYLRAADNTTWAQQCKVTGSTLLWGSHRGRWRTEDNLSFTIDSARGIARFVEKHSDGSRTEKTFPFDSLQH